MKNFLRGSFFGREVEAEETNYFGCWEAGAVEPDAVSEALPWVSRAQDEATEPMTIGSREVDGGFGVQEAE